MDLYYIEICRNGNLAAPGELGKVYITDLENRAIPWIRYEIGDVGRYFVDDHGCGSKSIRLQIDGRIEDTISNSKGNFELLCVPKNGVGMDAERVRREFRNFFDPDASIKTYTVKTIAVTQKAPVSKKMSRMNRL